MMNLSPANLLHRARDTIAAPRAGAAAILRMQLAPAPVWMALMLMAIGSAILTHISFAAMPPDARAFFAEAMRSPLRTAVLQGVAMLVVVQLIHKIGRLRGGTGSLIDTAALVAWLQFILLLLQAVQIVAQILIPPLGNLISIGSLVLMMWLLTNFVAELHGFQRLGATFAGIVLTMVAAALIIAVLLVLLLGVTGPEG